VGDHEQPVCRSTGVGAANNLPNDYIDTAVGGNDLVYDEYFSIPDLTLSAGTYYFQLFANSTDFGMLGWDVGNGSSSAYVNSLFTPVPSEFFQISGTTTSTPEPPTFALFGTGLLALAALTRSKLIA
jgi:hypothetical protein